MECGPKSGTIHLLFSRHFDKQGHGRGGIGAGAWWLGLRLQEEQL